MSQIGRKRLKQPKIHVNPRLSPDTHQKLETLAYTCEKKKTMMASLILDYALSQPWIVTELVKLYAPGTKGEIKRKHS